MLMSLSGKDVMVTGGNVGIGRPTALELARLGANVTIIGRNEATCSEAVCEITDATGNQKVGTFRESYSHSSWSVYLKLNYFNLL